MSLIVWDDSNLSVGVESIDKQHKQLVDLIEKLHSAMLTGNSKTVLKKIIDDMLNYTKKHFTYEEELLRKVNFVEFDAHHAKHVDFVDKVFDFQEKYLRGELLLSIELINFLKDWLLVHITVEDKKYSEKMIQNNII